MGYPVKVTYAKSSKKGAKRYTKNYSTVITVKNPSLSLGESKVTINVGDEYKINAKKSPSSATVTYTSSNPTAAYVNSKGVVTGTSEGASVITAKMTCGTKKVTKTITVTVKKPVEPTLEITDKPIDNTLSVGETFNLIVKATPEESVVSYAVDNESIATVNTNGAITAKAEGTAVVTITAAFEKQTVTKTLPITVIAKHENGITAEVTNKYNGLDNVVLVNQPANIRVLVCQDNKPAANKKVYIGLSAAVSYGSGVVTSGSIKTYDVIGDKTQVTDANGYATFTIANVLDSNVKATDINKVASFTYTLTSDNGIKIEKPLAFAAINFGQVKNLNHETPYTNGVNVYGVSALEPSLNDAGGDGFTETKATISSVSDKSTGAFVEYVDSQQVSTKDKDHKVKFGGFEPKLVIRPASAGNSSTKGVYFKNDKVAYTSGKYGTNNRMFEADKTNPYVFRLGYKPSELTYATLHFGTITLSKYTNLTIKTYKVKNGKVVVNSLGQEVQVGDTETLKGECVANDKTYSVPLTGVDDADDLEFRIQLNSADQVNLGQNAGYSFAYVDGVYQDVISQGESVGSSVTLSDLKVNWEVNSTAQYNTEQDLKKLTGINNITSRIDGYNSYSKVTYQVPSFPVAGNAIIRCYNNNNKVEKYYVCPTINNSKNVNELDKDAEYCYEVSEKEATDRVGTTADLVQDGKTVTVDSQVVGVTFLKGTITDANGAVPEGFDDTNKDIYTSVQWCPVPGKDTQDSPAAIVSTPYLALSGQMIDVTAQLCDKNGNPVSTKDVNVVFYNDGADDPSTGNHLDLASANVSSLTNTSGRTDKDGRVTLTLQAASATVLENLQAYNKKYLVKLYVGPAEKIDFSKKENAVEKADLYWVNANLKFTADANGATAADAATNDATDIAVAGTDTVAALEPTVGQKWEYRIGVTSGKVNGGVLAPTAPVTVTINGLKLKYETSGEGSFAEDEKLSVVTATSEKSGKFEILGKIDNTSLTNSDITFTIAGKTYAGVGSGNTNLNKRLTLKGEWKPDGEKIQIIAPNGATALAQAGSKISLYVKLTDNHGNVVPNKDVKVSWTNDLEGKVKTGAGVALDKTDIIKTDANGLVALTAEGTASSVNSVVSVYDAVDPTVKASVNISWTQISAVDAVTFSALNVDDKNVDGTYKSRVSDDGKKIILTFKDKINAESVIAKEFTVELTNAGSATGKYSVSSAVVNGKEVTLTINNGPQTIPQGAEFTVSAKAATDKDGIEHLMTDEYGRTIVENSRTFKLYYGSDNPPEDNR